jgi:hypothetical protein
MMVARLAVATNRKSVPRKPTYFLGSRRPTSSICFSIAVTTISEREHQSPREQNGAVELEKAVLPEDHLVGTETHG